MKNTDQNINTKTKGHKGVSIFSFLWFAVLFFMACNDFGDINTDPNNPSQPDTRFLYVGSRYALPWIYMPEIYNPWQFLYPQYLAEKNNTQFSTPGSSSFFIGNYYTYSIKNLNKIIELNSHPETMSEVYVTAFGDKNNQIAVARTLKAYIFMHLTDALGMIPYSEAMQAREGNFKPKYDDQESIYTDLNKELEEAYMQFDENSSLNSTYEILYNGDISKWKKFNASVRMQLAIKLFKRDEATGKTRFTKAFSDGFIRSNEDIFGYKYLNEKNNPNPFYDVILGTSGWGFLPSGTIIDSLKEYNDPRLKTYVTPNKFGTFYGMPIGLTPSEAAKLNPDTLSFIHPKFYYQQNTPAVLISPSIILLAAAEAAERGWIDASAENLYNEAIVAAFDQHGVSEQLTSYLAQARVKYKTAGTQSERLAQIAMQKWFASYLQDGFEAWSDWRRLGVPHLTSGTDPLIPEIPRRRVYHTDDYNANIVNYNTSVSLQGPDALNTRLWWDMK